MEEEIVPMSEWVIRKREVPELPERVEVPRPLLTPEEREKLKEIIRKSYEIARETGERVLDVLKRKIEEWKKEREVKKLEEAVPERVPKVIAVPEDEYVRLVEVKE